MAETDNPDRLRLKERPQRKAGGSAEGRNAAHLFLSSMGVRKMGVKKDALHASGKRKKKNSSAQLP